MLTFGCLAPSNSTAQYWSREQLEKANTAQAVQHLTDQEKEVIRYLNLARMYPAAFAANEIANYSGVEKFGYIERTSPYKQSLLQTLRTARPVQPLYFDEDLFQLARCFARESGRAGLVGHDRINCNSGYLGECCSYGYETGREIAISLLIDHNVPSLGHREICLSASYKKIGVKIEPHTQYDYCCVLDFQ